MQYNTRLLRCQTSPVFTYEIFVSINFFSKSNTTRDNNTRKYE